MNPFLLFFFVFGSKSKLKQRASGSNRENNVGTQHTIYQSGSDYKKTKRFGFTMNKA